MTGIAPAIICENPRFPHNIAMVTRLASCYGINQVWFTGSRIEVGANRKMRLPTKERMNVDIINNDNPLDQFSSNIIPVAVEFRDHSELLQDFVHPKNAVYIFGPEDGAISNRLLSKCHRFVVIPVRHCLNLSTSIATVLWDRKIKLNERHDQWDISEESPEELGLSGDNSWPKT
jgi:tRNA(Leu) C34 or U34 (ribose-2'-O)-methylase TrmL